MAKPEHGKLSDGTSTYREREARLKNAKSSLTSAIARILSGINSSIPPETEKLPLGRISLTRAMNLLRLHERSVSNTNEEKNGLRPYFGVVRDWPSPETYLKEGELNQDIQTAIHAGRIALRALGIKAMVYPKFIEQQYGHDPMALADVLISNAAKALDVKETQLRAAMKDLSSKQLAEQLFSTAMERSGMNGASEAPERDVPAQELFNVATFNSEEGSAHSAYAAFLALLVALNSLLIACSTNPPEQTAAPPKDTPEPFLPTAEPATPTEQPLSPVDLRIKLGGGVENSPPSSAVTALQELGNRGVILVTKEGENENFIETQFVMPSGETIGIIEIVDGAEVTFGNSTYDHNYVFVISRVPGHEGELLIIKKGDGGNLNASVSAEDGHPYILTDNSGTTVEVVDPETGQRRPVAENEFFPAAPTATPEFEEVEAEEEAVVEPEAPTEVPTEEPTETPAPTETATSTPTPSATATEEVTSTPNPTEETPPPTREPLQIPEGELVPAYEGYTVETNISPDRLEIIYLNSPVFQAGDPDGTNPRGIRKIEAMRFDADLYEEFVAAVFAQVPEKLRAELRELSGAYNQDPEARIPVRNALNRIESGEVGGPLLCRNIEDNRTMTYWLTPETKITTIVHVSSGPEEFGQYVDLSKVRPDMGNNGIVRLHFEDGEGGDSGGKLGFFCNPEADEVITVISLPSLFIENFKLQDSSVFNTFMQVYAYLLRNYITMYWAYQQNPGVNSQPVPENVNWGNMQRILRAGNVEGQPVPYGYRITYPNGDPKGFIFTEPGSAD